MSTTWVKADLFDSDPRVSSRWAGADAVGRAELDPYALLDAAL